MSKELTQEEIIAAIPEENITTIEEYTTTFLYVNPWFNVNIPCTTQEKIFALIDKLEKLNYEQQIKEVISFEGGFNPYLKLHSDDLQLKVSGVSRCTVSSALNFTPINKDECRIYNKVICDEIEARNKDYGIYVTFEECKQRFNTYSEKAGIDRRVLAGRQVRLLLEWFGNESCPNIDFIYNRKSGTGGKVYKDHLSVDGGGYVSCNYEGKKLFNYLHLYIHPTIKSGEGTNQDGINYGRYIDWEYHVMIANVKAKVKYLDYLLSIENGLQDEPQKKITDQYPQLKPDQVEILKLSLEYNTVDELTNKGHGSKSTIKRKLEAAGAVLGSPALTPLETINWAKTNRKLLESE